MENFMIEMSASQARTEQMLKDMNERLFGGPGQKGALSYMVERADERIRVEDVTTEKLTTRIVSLETWKTGTIKWVGGVVAVIGLEGTAVALYLNHIAAKVTMVTDFLSKVK